MIRIIVVGSLKEKYLKQAQEYLTDQIEKKTKIEIIEVEDEKTSEKVSEKEREKIKSLEAEKILSKLDRSSYLVAMDIEGKPISAKEMKMILVHAKGKSRLSFIIGGSLGLSETVKRASHMRVSFSNLTFPHQLFRIMLLDQIESSL